MIGSGLGSTSVITTTGAKASVAQDVSLGYVLGSPYDAFPRHANVVKEMRGLVRVLDADVAGNSDSAGQVTTLAWLSATRRMDMDITVREQSVLAQAASITSAHGASSAALAKLLQTHQQLQKQQQSKAQVESSTTSAPSTPTSKSTFGQLLRGRGERAEEPTIESLQQENSRLKVRNSCTPEMLQPTLLCSLGANRSARAAARRVRSCARI
jgi:hypothetical protein